MSTGEWPQRDIDFLVDNWGSIPASAIGKVLGGRSKSAVVGKAHRMGLPKLIAAPVRYASEADKIERTRLRRIDRYWKTKTSPIPRAGRVTLAGLGSVKAAASEVRPNAAVIPFPTPPPRRMEPVHQPPMLSKRPCCFPLGDPKQADFKFCGDPTELGKPYCPEHVKVAYVKRERRKVEEVA